MQLFDMATGLLYAVKRPAPEVRNYAVDFTNLCPSVSTVISVTALLLTQGVSTLTIGTPRITGTLVNFSLSGGAVGDIYEIQLNVSDTAGEVISEAVMIKIKQTGNS
jgi:hypothetical protein